MTRILNLFYFLGWGRYTERRGVGCMLFGSQNRFHKGASEGTITATTGHRRPEMVNPNVSKHHHSLGIFIEQEEKKRFMVETDELVSNHILQECQLNGATSI